MCCRIPSASQGSESHETVGQASCIPPLIIALGIITVLGGVFLTLAAYQIFPHSVNVISNLGIWREVIGYGTLGLGVIIVVAGAVKRYYNMQALENAPADSKNVIEENRVMIQQAVIEENRAAIQQDAKTVLDDLFGGPGTVDKIPSFPQEFVRYYPKSAEMNDSIMQGCVLINADQPTPFIAIKMRCTNTPEEVQQKLRQQVSISKELICQEQVMCLYQCLGGDSSKWCQWYHTEGPVSPRFFGGHITSSGHLNHNAKASFTQLQQMLREGHAVEDGRGI